MTERHPLQEKLEQHLAKNTNLAEVRAYQYVLDLIVADAKGESNLLDAITQSDDSALILSTPKATAKAPRSGAEAIVSITGDIWIRRLGLYEALQVDNDRVLLPIEREPDLSELISIFTDLKLTPTAVLEIYLARKASLLPEPELREYLVDQRQRIMAQPKK